jgi:hypothetical protein
MSQWYVQPARVALLADKTLPELRRDGCSGVERRRTIVSEPDDLGYVASFTFASTSMEEAARQARRYAQILHICLPGIEAESTTVAIEGARSRKVAVFCGQRLSRDPRCMLAAGHNGQHCPDWSV